MKKIILLLGLLAIAMAPDMCRGQQISRLNDATLKAISVTDKWTRPNDTTAYAANDAIAVGSGGATNLPRAISIAGVRPGSAVVLRKVLYSTFQATNVNSVRVWFYTSTNAVQQDNAAFALSQAKYAALAGWLDITNCATGTDCNFGQNTVTPINLQLATSDTSLYYHVQALSAFTPVAYQTNVFTFSFESQ